MASLQALFYAAAHRRGRPVSKTSPVRFATNFHEHIEECDVPKLRGIQRLAFSTEVQGTYSWDWEKCILRRTNSSKARGYKHLRVHPQLIAEYLETMSAVEFFVKKYVTNDNGKLQCLAENRSASVQACFSWACQHDQEIIEGLKKGSLQPTDTPLKVTNALKELFKDSASIQYESAKRRGQGMIYMWDDKTRSVKTQRADSARSGWSGLLIREELKAKIFK